MYARVVSAGFEGEKEPWDAFWGQRYALLGDPDGVQVNLSAALTQPSTGYLDSGQVPHGHPVGPRPGLAGFGRGPVPPGESHVRGVQRAAPPHSCESPWNAGGPA